MIRSIRVTLTLWYVGILAAILSVFAWVLYTNVSANLFRDIDQILASQADGVADSIFAFLEAKEDTLLPTSHEIQKEVEAGRFDALVTDWAHEMSESESTRPIRVMDRQRHVLCATASFRTLQIPPTESIFTKADRGRTVYSTFNRSGHRVRLITRPIIEDGQILYFVQTSTNLRHADSSLAQLRLWLFWLVPLTLIFASSLGWFLATLALRPIARMITQAQRIGIGQLHERIDVPRTGDELERLAATFNDMLARLDRAFRRMRQFSAAASHELRTPLTVMKGELEVALRAPRDVPEYRRVLGTQVEALNEMVSIVEQLLTLAHSEEGEEAVEWRPVEWVALVRQAHELWQKIAEEKKVRIKIFESGPVRVRGEARLLARLVGNLLDNAVKHTPPHGEVTLRIEKKAEGASLTVQDTGPGISADELPKIFDKFFTRSSSNEGVRSSGLGLGLCRWIVEAHQGRIEVSSSPGRGTTFTVWLPFLVPL